MTDRAAPAWFDAHVEDRAGSVVVVRGEIDIASATAFSAVIDEAISHGDRVVVDFNEISFMDSTGLRVLVGAYRALGQRREALVVRSPSDMVRRALQVSGVAELVTIDERAAAVAGVDTPA